MDHMNDHKRGGSDEQRAVKVSRYLSLHLRHRPDRIGLALDARGSVPVEELLAAAAADGFPIGREELEHVVAVNDKRRFTVEDGRIRALQGHSVPVDLGLPAVEPPAYLYHGTVARSLPAIRAQGLRSMSRHHVHLSPDRDTATRVGARRGRPLVLTVDAGAMHGAGLMFHRTANGVWLTAAVPPRYLVLAQPHAPRSPSR
ncbi:RNA 2'-phosphotransferase [Streptomyces fuscigenes]|uniref:RNA 2'-phosphotransferase n=1 Tax=Streptomyces fuscigenes TaxID=1528880 RepID=UPI001F33E442|nr:RNA 2'-phosphotransferase [Streptomyces fuscigenes]MCF3961906.1 RNA 2'-phosphotransferase [Streptomyces fuscigenes]